MVSRGVRRWIAALCLMVLAMVLIGGITRLTRSGLSIVEWQPISGIVPPLDRAAWQAAFDAYRRYPEYQQVNVGMTLGEFKRIYFWEYLHRLFGRLIALALGVPLVVLAARRALSRPLLRRLGVVFVLGGMQGLLGWYMVKSGLVNVPRVSHLRLAAHLSLAFLLFGFLYWTYLEARANPGKARPPSPPDDRRAFGPTSGASAGALWLTAVVAVQIVFGAFVAGLRAGAGFNTFPLMNGRMIPDGVLALSPAWLNLFDNPATVQLVHRTLAWLLLGGTLIYWRRTRAGALEIRRAASVLLVAVGAQFALGVATLLLVVPLTLAALHQIGAFGVVAAVVYLNWVVFTDRGAAQSPTLSATSTP